MRRALLIFARTPEGEARAKRLPVAVAAPMFESVIVQWLGAARDANADVIVACAPRDRERLSRIAPDALWIDQGPGTFGARLSAAVTETFARHYDVVAVTGIDTMPVDLRAIFECGVNVIVPAGDGGVNLIALIADAPDVLATLQPRQRDAAARCEALLHAIVLPPSRDLDDIGDLREWLNEQPVVRTMHRVAMPRRQPSAASLRAPPLAA